MTTEAIPERLLNDFSAALASRIGLHFSGTGSRELLRGTTRAAREFGFIGADACAACMRWLLTEPATRRQDEILASHLSIGETYFFREPVVFSMLERAILPPLVAAQRAAGKRLRIWSAGCSSGEEAHSLAILLTRLIPDIDDWSVHLLGTDIHTHRLDMAERGVYRDWSFRGVPPWVKQHCFDTDDAANFTLNKRFKRLAGFAYLNLATDAYPSPESATQSMDVVMCRNVLMYFDEAMARTVVQKLRRSLVDGGWLIVGQVESALPLFHGFVPVMFEDGIAFRKHGACERVPEPMAIADEAMIRPIETCAMPMHAPVSGEGGLADTTAGKDLTLSGDAQSLASLARASADLLRLDDARQWCEAAIAADKFDARLRYLLATILTEQGHIAQATDALRQALYLDRQFVLAWFALGNLYRRDGRAQAAARQFAIASRLLSRYPPESTLPDADGLTAGRLLSIIDAMERTA